MNRKLAVIASIACGLAIVCIAVRGAGTNAAEEAAIRQIIAGGKRPALTADSIFWSGAYKRPVIGAEKPVPYDGPLGVANRVPGSQRTKTDVIRLVVSESGDMAYEYSKGTLEYDIKSGAHIKFDTGALTVWQKEDGQWKIAAQFVRPYDTPFAPSTDAAKQ